MPAFQCYVQYQFRVLEQAPVKYGAICGDFGWFDREVPTNGGHHGERTHSARLLCVQPIVRDTAESILRELADWLDWDGLPNGRKEKPTLHDIRERARKLLDL